MTKDEWKEFHRAFRLRRQLMMDTKGLLLMRDERGFLGVTQKHTLGHVVGPAAIANKLRYAALDRTYPPSHRVLIAQVRMIRKTGTWFGG